MLCSVFLRNLFGQARGLVMSQLSHDCPSIYLLSWIVRQDGASGVVNECTESWTVGPDHVVTR